MSFLSETWVESSISKGKVVYRTSMLKKGEGETPLHSAAKHLIHEFGDVCLSDLPLGLPLSKDIER